MSLSSKILLFIFAILTVLTCGFIVYKQMENAKQLANIQTSLLAQKQLVDNISRAQAQYATKDDINNFAQQHDIDLNAIRQDLATLNAQVSAIGNFTVASNSQNATNISSTSTSPNPTPSKTGPDPYGYLKNTQNLDINEQFTSADKKNTIDVPFGTASFSAWKDKPWSLNVPQRKYSVTSVLGTDPNGRNYSYSKFAIIANGKTYDVAIDENKFLQEYPTAKFTLINPKLFLGLGGSVDFTAPPRGEMTPDISVSIASYGKTTTSPDMVFIQPGIGYGVISKTPQVTLSPIQFNIGKVISPTLMNNTYLGPTIQVGTDGAVSAGAAIKVGL